MLHTLRTRRALAALALLTPLGAMLTATAPAQAGATTWTVTNSNADGAFTAVSGQVTVKNKAGTTLFTCASLTSTGKLVPGTRTGSALGSIDTTAATTCTGPEGTVWNATGVMMGDSALVGNSYNAATGTSSITNGPNSTSVNIAFTSRDTAHQCAFFTRSTAMTYTNSTATLKTTTAVVKVATASGSPTCQGLLTQGETITFATEYALSPAVKITASTN
ncbi:hypothetical protein [Nocardia jejuensis]|uniref:hypothetical protein n=1 Tax=Nocardia jejuensis TaxID=328049 RepID=UPI00082DCCB3|nr:hypothetical protein [Nocardia jejuensis]